LKFNFFPVHPSLPKRSHIPSDDEVLDYLASMKGDYQDMQGDFIETKIITIFTFLLNLFFFCHENEKYKITNIQIQYCNPSIKR
jgi:hypothetical protein